MRTTQPHDGRGHPHNQLVLHAHSHLAHARKRQDMGLWKYAEEFAARGIASLMFDYRNFGGSDGMPRNLADPWRQDQYLNEIVAQLPQRVAS